jgi:hypothetical protein
MLHASHACQVTDRQTRLVGKSIAARAVSVHVQFTHCLCNLLFACMIKPHTMLNVVKAIQASGAAAAGIDCHLACGSLTNMTANCRCRCPARSSAT